ncbi:MAG: hypothetical protein ACPGU1_03170 [Myxococcota bacterium]
MRLSHSLVALVLCLGACGEAVDDGQGGQDGAGVIAGDVVEDVTAGADTSLAVSDAASTTEADAQDTPQDTEQAADDTTLVEDVASVEDSETVDVMADATPADIAMAPDTTVDVEAPEADSTEDGVAEDAMSSSDVDDAPEDADTASASDTGESDVSASDAVVESDVADVASVEDAVDGEAIIDGAGGIDASDDASGDAEVIEDVDTGPPLPPKPLYLLSVNNAQKTLEKINVETGEGTDVCQLPPTSNYPSLTFSRDNILFASRQGQYLDAIDPCTCEVSPVGSYNGFTGVNGITSDFGLNLFGVSHVQDVLISINSQSGSGTSIGSLGVNFGYTGATWSDEEQVIYAIDATSDGLYTISPSTGEATFVAPLSLPLGTVGIEMHPANGILYACSDPAHLLAVDLITGEVTDLGDMGQNTACNNLAAPWKEVPCLDDI